MNDTVFYVGGSKGGVGKSMVSLCLVDYLISRFAGKKQTVLIETDDSNPDVGTIYKDTIPTDTVILDERENGWINFFNIVEDKYKDCLIVVNSAARSNTGLKAHGKNFSASLEEMGIDLITLWPMNRQADSVNLLIEYLKIFEYGETFPMINTYFGQASEFVIFEDIYEGSSSDSKYLKKRCGRDNILVFPSLNDLISLSIYSKRQKLSEVSKTLQIFQRQLYKTWQSKVYEMFDSSGIIDMDSANTLEE